MLLQTNIDIKTIIFLCLAVSCFYQFSNVQTIANKTQIV